MTRKRTIRLVGKSQRQHACNQIMAASPNFVVVIQEETRSQAQNRKMWPMIADMQKQVAGMAGYAADDIKLQFLDALKCEMRLLPKLDGSGSFLVGQRSSQLSKSQFIDLIEVMHMYGASKGVEWSDKSQQALNDILPEMEESK